jgi:hypothetical protein
MLEESQIVDRGFDTKDEAELVVEFERYRLYSVDGDVAAVLVDSLDIDLFAKHDVGRVLAMIYAPVIVNAGALMYWSRSGSANFG